MRRVYEEADPAEDGLRVLVDRLWPRGMKKEDARLDVWAKEIAPSGELRKWYAHDRERWTGFRERYRRRAGRARGPVRRWSGSVSGPRERR